ncbi:MAG: carbohydrate ABC transporter substrate-binding protein [Pseudomonadota bacterium]
MTYHGLTWDHPRGYDALAEAARRVNAGRDQALIHWDKQPLEGFESAAIANLAAAHDLIVLDHPHIGEAVAEQCLIPLEDLYPPEQIAAWEAESVGPSFASYRWAGKSWALPLDVATQVVARRSDRIAGAPESWDEIEGISSRLPTALSIGGPHAFLTLISMAAGFGAVAGGDELLPDNVALSALSRMQRLARAAPDGSDTLNPIALLETMARSDNIALVPLVFGYVTYARAGYAPHVVSFSDTPRKEHGFGGVLGGTGIGFSRRGTPSKELLDHVAWLMKVGTQTQFFPKFGGQPSARTAWRDASLNADWDDFYISTVSTADRALLRPRFDGYVGFQNLASARIRQALLDREDEQKTLSALRAQWRDARLAARGEIEAKG